jgi:hypothetical protein
MSRKFDELVTEALAVEREIRALSGDKPSLRCFIAECLTRSGESYEAVEQVKERLLELVFGRKSGCSAFVRDLTRQVANGRFPTPPEAKRIGSLYFNQKDEAVMELGGEPKRLFSLWIISAELAHHQNPGVFGTVEDIEKHKARLAELEEKRKELHKRIPTSWDNSDVVIGRITSDFAALITWRMAPDCPVGNRDVAERLIDWLLERDAAKSAKAA